MAAGINDSFRKASSGSRPEAAQLTAQKNLAASSIITGALNDWPTDTAVDFVIYNTDTQNLPIDGSQTDWKGIVSGNTITNLTLVAGTDQVYPIGATVVATPTAGWADALVDGLLEEHDQDGTHGAVTATSLTTPTATITSLTATNLTITGTANSEGWSPLGQTPNTITNNGNRSYDLVFNSVDLTDTLSEGMRMKFTRTVTAPTQSTELNGTTQYWSKSSPTGVIFTSTFSSTAWVNPSSYGSSAIIGRDSAAANLSGWEFGINSTGQVNIYARNATGAILGTSTQSVPLNKWSHVAGTLNAATGTVLIYIDGVLVPSTTAAAGTTIVQASTDLTIGKRNGAANFFAGKIAQVSLYSSVISASDVRASMSQALTGSESGLISGYSFNGVATDLNITSANNLSATASAGYTSDSPFANGSRTYDTAGTTEHAVVATKPTFSTNTTVTVQVPEGCAIPTSGGVSAVSYSTQSKPYGFPTNKARWIVENLAQVSLSQSAPTINIWYNVGGYITVPKGNWNLSYSATIAATEGSGSTASAFVDVSTSPSSSSLGIYSPFYRRAYLSAAPGITAVTHLSPVYVESDITLTTATPQYVILLQDGTIDTLYIWANQGAAVLKATPNFL